LKSSVMMSWRSNAILSLLLIQILLSYRIQGYVRNPISIQLFRRIESLIPPRGSLNQRYGSLGQEEERPLYPEKEELKALISNGVSRSDNFWESTFPIYQKKSLEAIQNNDEKAKLDADERFFELMNTGFQRRLFVDYEESAEEQARNAFAFKSPVTLLKDAADMTSRHFELSVSKSDQLRELKAQQLLSRSGLIRLVPQPLHKFIDYLTSLRKDPKSGELTRNVAVSVVFATVTMLNARARMATLYALVGNVAIMSILLARNMPKSNAPMGMEKNKVSSWSTSAFRTAVGVTSLFAAMGGLVTGGMSMLIPGLDSILRMRISLALSVLCSGYFTSFYEVFEEKSKNGWRWKRAAEGFLPADVQARLKQQVFGAGDTPITELYDFAYDPQIDDYPPLPRYLDEVNGVDSADGLGIGGCGELDEDVAQQHYEDWKAERRDARKAPVLDALPEEKWVGSKAGMFIEREDAPKWLNSAYEKNVLQANKWRGRPTKYVKDTTEFEKIEGPIGFRDKQPEWLDMFGPGIWEEKLMASRAAAREFGTYRKTMWKIDDQVKLRPCDGADKEV